jgi:3D (Asp-Asp-Asp) domain-containing protein
MHGTTHNVDITISSEIFMSDPICFKRVFVLSSTMLLAIGGALMLYLDAAGAVMGDDSRPTLAVDRAAMRPLEPQNPRLSAPVPELLPAVFYYSASKAPMQPQLLPVALLQPLELPVPSWPITLSYHEAVADPAYYKTWLEARNPGVRFRAVHAIVTGYCPCPICCGAGAHGITYTGVHTSREPYGIAAPEALVNHEIHVPGYMFESEPGKFWKADDTGGAVNRSWSESHVYHFDVRFMSHDWAQRWWGYRTMTVYISQ